MKQEIKDESRTMKAIVCPQYGSPDVLELQEIERPEPGDGEILIRVEATGLNAADWRLMRADPFFVRFMLGLLKPKNLTLGSDIAGEVVAVGQKCTQFRPGDAVFSDLSSNGLGGLAEYVCAPETMVAPKPTNLDFYEAAAVPMAAVTALQGLRDHGKIDTGHKVLINGASGGVGTFAIQIAKAFGAEVTAVCSTTKLALARSLGADHVVDYTKDDFAQRGQKYDLILAVNGSRPLAAYIDALTPAGCLVVIGGSMKQLFLAMLLGPIKTRSSGKAVRTFTAQPNQQDLLFIKALIEEGKVKPVIDKRYSLAESADAMRYLEEGHANGKVVVTPRGNQ